MARFQRPPVPARRWPDLNDEERRAILDWLVTTCLLFGTQRSTAYRVAAHFAEGLDAN